MSRILACTTGPEDWRQLLARPDKHWRTGRSAKSLAHCWEAADGLPPEIASALTSAPGEVMADVQPFLAIPEFQTDLPGGERPSQTDILVLGRARGGAFAIAVEGKVTEPFGPTLEEWWRDASDGKRLRWASLCATLGLAEQQSLKLRYQLFHRAASAVLAARRFHCPLAVLLVHSFCPDATGFADFERFAGLFAAAPARGNVVPLAQLGATQFLAGWADGDQRFATL